MYSLDEIAGSPVVHDPLTKLQCCPTSDGAAAAIVASEQFVKENNLQDQVRLTSEQSKKCKYLNISNIDFPPKAVEILAIEMATDFPSTFGDKSCLKMVGSDLTKSASSRVFAQSGVKPSEVDVIELHDCFSANELITYEALGLCPEGKGGQMVEEGDNDYGGKYVVNPSGGLISKGHPLGATGLAQCTELCQQLRGKADKRQVKGAKVALQHNLGLGGAAVVAMYRMLGA